MGRPLGAKATYAAGLRAWVEGSCDVCSRRTSG